MQKKNIFEKDFFYLQLFPNKFDSSSVWLDLDCHKHGKDSVGESGRKIKIVIEKLYYSTDSITSTVKFNNKYKDKIGRMGEQTLGLYDFAQKMNKTDFKRYDIERFIKDITDQDIHLSPL